MTLLPPRAWRGSCARVFTAFCFGLTGTSVRRLLKPQSGGISARDAGLRLERLLRRLFGTAARDGYSGSGCGAGTPTYRAAGRTIFESRACSSTLAHQPITRLEANVGVNMSRGMPDSSMTTPAYHSTFV